MKMFFMLCAVAMMSVQPAFAQPEFQVTDEPVIGDPNTVYDLEEGPMAAEDVEALYAQAASADDAATAPAIDEKAPPRRPPGGGPGPRPGPRPPNPRPQPPRPNPPRPTPPRPNPPRPNPPRPTPPRPNPPRPNPPRPNPPRPNPPRPRPPRPLPPRPVPPSNEVVCYAQNTRGEVFRAFGWNRFIVQERAMDKCEAVSRSCRPLGCRYY